MLQNMYNTIYFMHTTTHISSFGGNGQYYCGENE